MTLLDRVRATARSRLAAGLPGATRPDASPSRLAHGLEPQPRPVGPARLWALVPAAWRVAGCGALAAALGWLAVLAVVLLSWMLTPGGDVGAGSLLGLSAGLWLLGVGVPVQAPTPAGPVPVGVTPLLVWGFALWLAVAWLTRARRAAPEQSVRELVGRFAGGYAAALAALTLLALAGPLRPDGLGLLRALLVPTLALAHDVLTDPPEALAERLPAWLTRSWRPAAYGLVTLAGAGLLLVLGALVARWDTVTSLYAAAGATGVAAALLTLAQLPFLPNLVLWAGSVLVGPGFHLGGESVVSLSGGTLGLLPLVPVFGAMPEGAFPSWTRAGLLLPLVAGMVIGRTAQRRWVRLAHWSGPFRTAGAAVGQVVGAWLVLALLGSGPAGGDRLSHLGPDVWLVCAILCVELTVGAASWLTLSRSRAWLVRPGPGQPRSDHDGPSASTPG
jgi:hypothetical protein